jgi:ribosomal protein S18 acetylase RimI-like enzyme
VAPRASGSAPSPVQIRRLGPADTAVLSLLSREDADFDLAERGMPHLPLGDEAARAYLGDPRVLHWVGEVGSVVVGFLSAHHLPLRSGDGAEVLLYEIGVRDSHRRQGIGRALIAALRAWMAEAGVSYVWLLADNDEARVFYEACGFRVNPGPAIYLEARAGAPRAG